MKYKRVYLIGGTNGKDDHTDYVIGYKAEDGSYIEKRWCGLSVNSAMWYAVDGHEFLTLREAKSYCERRATA